MKPEIVRKIVVLPQPDGPRMEKNSPPAIFSEASFTATKSPKRMVTSVDVDVGAHAPAVFCPKGALQTADQKPSSAASAVLFPNWEHDMNSRCK